MCATEAEQHDKLVAAVRPRRFSGWDEQQGAATDGGKASLQTQVEYQLAYVIIAYVLNGIDLDEK